MVKRSNIKHVSSQWHSQALKSGWAQGVWQRNLQLANAFLRRFVPSSNSSAIPPRKKLRICANFMTQHGRAGWAHAQPTRAPTVPPCAVPTRGYATVSSLTSHVSPTSISNRFYTVLNFKVYYMLEKKVTKAKRLRVTYLS